MGFLLELPILNTSSQLGRNFCLHHKPHLKFLVIVIVVSYHILSLFIFAHLLNTLNLKKKKHHRGDKFSTLYAMITGDIQLTKRDKG